jgi:CRISPR/Cas system CSM-associated protein Csm2 small subunit
MDAIKSRNDANKKQLSPSQKKAMMKEIRRQCANYYRKHETELIALILWELHTQLGFGKKRLRRFWENFTPTLDTMLDRYEMEEDDRFWLCVQKLKEIDIDIEAWQNEGVDTVERESEEK